ncbi:permease-like cell division protein FtsX [Candidatus Shapirobacteria bacterium]|nr:permease-like cell division protein FtsX [Candidatus Shapirobacteria bacterium]
MNSFKTALNHIRRSPYQTVLIILVLFFSFFLLTSFAVLAFASQKILTFFEAKPQAIAYLKDEATAEQVQAVIDKLKTTGKVKEIKYVSKEEALKIYQEANKDNPLLLEMVTADILPASLEISATNIAYLEELASILEQEEIVSVSESGRKEIDFAKDIATSLRQWTQTIRKVGIGLGAFLVAECFLLILVITSMKIALRREEVEIVRLLGGSSWFARLPFLLEGAIYGFFGSLLGAGATYLLLSQGGKTAEQFLGNIGIFPLPSSFLLALFGGNVIFASFLCSLASFTATRRYLK